ncbi:MAG: pyridoxal-phosphate dependent enzyme [Gammaproteobacteria bacterium]|jgi:D-cysteine desulfhydrase|nr:pyridoxal-phosphate dependent enzyme [Gammaproteobacteria bacterium]
MTAPPSRPLLQRWPELTDSLPWSDLGLLPTPVQSWGDLAAAWGVGTLTCKRDDVSAAVYGGNKIRKLELLLPDAVARGKRAVLTYGGLGSNHALATAIYAREAGLRCGAVLTPEPVTAAVRRSLSRHLQLGTELVLAASYADIRAAAAQLTARLGGDAACAEIPFGGSNWLGTIGFVNAALELAEQIAAGELPRPDVIYVACGTAGTVAGLALGCELAGLNCRIEGVQVTPDSLRPAELARELYAQAGTELRQRLPGLPAVSATGDLLQVRGDQLGGGYAQPTPAAIAARDAAEAATGLPVSLTYTAKALAALHADAQAGRLAGHHVLFWNTYNSQPWPAAATPADRCLPADIAALLD